jgi:hypothetical protein
MGLGPALSHKSCARRTRLLTRRARPKHPAENSHHPAIGCRIFHRHANGTVAELRTHGGGIPQEQTALAAPGDNRRRIRSFGRQMAKQEIGHTGNDFPIQRFEPFAELVT